MDGFKYSFRWCSELARLKIELKAHEGSGWHDGANLKIQTGSATVETCVHAADLQIFHEELGKWLRLMSLERYAQTGNKSDIWPKEDKNNGGGS